MIKVVGIDTSKVKHITCWKCASVLEYVKADEVTIYTKRDYLGDRDSFQGIVCPQCNQELMV